MLVADVLQHKRHQNIQPSFVLSKFFYPTVVRMIDIRNTSGANEPCPSGASPAANLSRLGAAMFYRHFSARHSRFRRFSATNCADVARVVGAPGGGTRGGEPARLEDG